MHWVEVLQWYGHHRVDDNALLPLRAEDKMISSNDEIGRVFRIDKLRLGVLNSFLCMAGEGEVKEKNFLFLFPSLSQLN